MHFANRLAVLILIGVAALVSTAQAANHVVKVVDTVFIPSSLTIQVNDTVTWQNDGFLAHTSTSGNPCRSNGKWDSAILNPGGSFTPPVNPFTATGNYPYYCVLHCLVGMTGAITVVEAPVPVESATWGAIKALYRSDTR